MPDTSKRKHYKIDEKGISSSLKEVFLVFIYDEQNKSPEIAGSYNTHKDARSTSDHFLKSGICSWIVSRNG